MPDHEPDDCFDYAHRLRHAASRIAEAGLDALLISHLPNLLYLSGLESSSAVGVLTRAPRLVVFTDGRYAASLARRVDHIGADLLTATIVESGAWVGPVAACLGGIPARTAGIEGDHLTVAAARGLAQALTEAGHAATLEPVAGVIESLRRVKDAVELDILREAGARLSEVARGLLRDAVVAVDRRETEVAAEVDHRMRLAGFARPAFETIVAAGPNSALPHARPSARRIEAGEPVVLDFGGVFRRYCVDLTRTLCMGSPSAALDRMYGAVADAQRAALAAIVPGIEATAVDLAARRTLTEAGYGPAFGHATGHGLGLEVHEAPRLGPRRPAAAEEGLLEAGVVCTVEPGAYVVGLGGVRIEDDVAVSAAGHEPLTDVPLGWSSAH